MDKRTFLDELDAAVAYFHDQSGVCEGPDGNNLRTALNSVGSASSDIRRELNEVEPATESATEPAIGDVVSNSPQTAWDSLTEEQRQDFIAQHSAIVTDGGRVDIETVKPWQRSI